MNKKLLVLLSLMLCVGLLLSACTKANETDETNQTTQVKEETTKTTEQQPVETTEPILMDYYVPGLLEDQPNTEIWDTLLQLVEDETNVKINLNLYDWGDSFNQKMNMYASSGDLPSGVWIFSEVIKDQFMLTTLNTMGEAGMFYNWNPYINDPETPQLLENATQNFCDMMKADDDNLYIFPTSIHFEFPHAPGGVTLRRDWLESLNLDYPETEEDLYNIIVAFKNNIVDDNGDPVIPFSLTGFEDTVEIYVLRFWMSPWMGHTAWYTNDDGSIDYALFGNVEGMTAGLAFLNRLWNDGLFDKEAFSQKPEQFSEKAVTSKIGVTSWSYKTLYTVNEALGADDPNARFVAIPPKTFNPSLVSQDEVYACQIEAVPMKGLVVTTEGISDDDMAAYVKLINWVGQFDNNVKLSLGLEGDYWEYNSEGNVVYTETRKEIDLLPSEEKPKDGLGMIDLLSTNRYVQSAMLQQIGMGPATGDFIDNMKGYQAAMQDPVNVAVQGPIEQEKWPLLLQSFQQMFIEAVSAPDEEACKSVYISWLEDRDALGYQEVCEERLNTANELIGK